MMGMMSKVLSDEQIEKIHIGSLAILESVGVVVPHEEVLNRFEDAGAYVDRSSGRVRIPPELVARSIPRESSSLSMAAASAARASESASQTTSAQM